MVNGCWIFSIAVLLVAGCDDGDVVVTWRLAEWESWRSDCTLLENLCWTNHFSIINIWCKVVHLVCLYESVWKVIPLSNKKSLKCKIFWTVQLFKYVDLESVCTYREHSRQKSSQLTGPPVKLGQLSRLYSYNLKKLDNCTLYIVCKVHSAAIRYTKILLTILSPSSGSP